jgi:ferredoxin
MFRSSNILREFVQILAKVILVFLLKHLVKLRRCILCGDVAACREMACVLFVVQTEVCTTNSTHAVSRHAATSPHNTQRRNFTECLTEV